MADNPIPGAGNTYPRRVVDDPNLWPELVQAYSTYKPKKILAEGDSWLAYPQILGVRNITLQLADNQKDYKDLILLCLARSGDEAVSMMSSLSNKKQLMDALISYEFDVLLFSGGGNDIVGEWDFDFFLDEKKDGMPWQKCVNDERLDRRVAQIKNAYLDLLDYTFTYARSKETIKVVAHTYDYPIPDPKGVLGGKSWMWPYLMQKKIYDPADQIAISRHAIDKFAAMLNGIEISANGRFKVVDTRGLVGKDEWANEIHPTTAGFKKVTDKIYRDALK